jgi:hypothetical protein
MSGEIINLFPPEPSLDQPVDTVLDAARAEGLASVLVLGEYPDGTLYFESSMSDGPSALWMLALAQRHLLNVATEDEE